MMPESIFGPVTTLAIWSGGALLINGYRRVRAVLGSLLRASAFKLGESADAPADLVVVNRHFMNLLEMPVLFYVVCLALRHPYGRCRDGVLSWLRACHGGAQA